LFAAWKEDTYIGRNELEGRNTQEGQRKNALVRRMEGRNWKVGSGGSSIASIRVNVENVGGQAGYNPGRQAILQPGKKISMHDRIITIVHEKNKKTNLGANVVLESGVKNNLVLTVVLEGRWCRIRQGTSLVTGVHIYGGHDGGRNIYY
jgi:hypothetical protein